MNRHTPAHPVAAPAQRLLCVAAFTLLALLLSAAAAIAKPIPGQYIVTVKDGHDPVGIARAIQAKPMHVYTSALNGFAAKLNDGQLTALRHNPSVELVEQDAEVSAAGTQFMDVAGEPWGLDRIDQTTLPLSKSYTWSKDGTGVRAYVIDSGVQADHSAFGGRALNVYNATSGSAVDCNGHGTHVAGTIASRPWGVAKNAYVRAVKVLDCAGNGTWSDVIEGIDWVKANHIQPAVANISIQGPVMTSVNTAVNNLVAADVFVAVAAGNDNVNACGISPASAVSAYTTASSTKSDAKSGTSNWGSCVDIYAPGNLIKSTTLGGGSGFMSGTSMASPHVAGTAALLCSYGAPYCHQSFITSWLTSGATSSVISGNPAGTPNRLLYMGGPDHRSNRRRLRAPRPRPGRSASSVDALEVEHDEAGRGRPWCARGRAGRYRLIRNRARAAAPVTAPAVGVATRR